MTVTSMSLSLKLGYVNAMVLSGLLQTVICPGGIQT